MKMAVLIIYILFLAGAADAQEAKGTTAREMYESCNSERERFCMLCIECNRQYYPHFDCECPERATGSWVEPTL
jgi:hypothetical protein